MVLVSGGCVAAVVSTSQERRRAGCQLRCTSDGRKHPSRPSSVATLER